MDGWMDGWIGRGKYPLDDEGLLQIASAAHFEPKGFVNAVPLQGNLHGNRA